MQTLRIGTATIDNIVEMEVAFEPEWLLYEAKAADTLALLPAYGPSLIEPGTGRLKLVIQSYLIRTPDQTILIDTCNGDQRQRPSVPFFHMLQTAYYERLTRLIDPAKVDVVLCSHLHVDHVGWNVKPGGDGFIPTFPNAVYVFSGAEYEWWRDVHRRGSGSAQAKAAFLECVEPLVSDGRARLVDSNHILASGPDLEIALQALPGHTLHQVGAHIRSGGRHAFFIADAVHHAVQFERPHWRSRPDSNPGLGERTARQLIEDYVDTDTLILTGHSPAPTVCRLVRGASGARLKFA